MHHSQCQVQPNKAACLGTISCSYTSIFLTCSRQFCNCAKWAIINVTDSYLLHYNAVFSESNTTVTEQYKSLIPGWFERTVDRTAVFHLVNSLLNESISLLIIAGLPVILVNNVCHCSLSERPCMYRTQRIWAPLSILMVTMATVATSRQLMRAIRNKEFQHQ